MCQLTCGYLYLFYNKKSRWVLYLNIPSSFPGKFLPGTLCLALPLAIPTCFPFSPLITEYRSYYPTLDSLWLKWQRDRIWPLRDKQKPTMDFWGSLCFWDTDAFLFWFASSSSSWANSLLEHPKPPETIWEWQGGHSLRPCYLWAAEAKPATVYHMTWVWEEKKNQPLLKLFLVGA